MKKYIIVKGIAGLGNRLITLTTAISYAKQTNRQIIVDWTEGQFAKRGQNAFFKCFDLRNIAHLECIYQIENITELSVYPNAWKNSLHTDGYIFVFKRYKFPFLSRQIKKLRLKGEITKLNGFWKLRYVERNNLGNKAGFTSDNSVLTFKDIVKGIFSSKGFPHGRNFTVKRKEDIVVYMDYQPEKVIIDDFINHIALKPHMLSIIEEYTNRLNLNTNAVGVHVRYTDKMPPKNISIIIDKIKALKINDPLIFLATDNSEVFSFFKKHFSNLFSFGENMPKPPNKNKGIHHIFNEEISFELFQQSIIDMWLLSRCDYLFYQGNSSFSLISSYLHQDKNKTFDWLVE